MKHLTLLLIALQLISSAYAQQNTKQSEAWITDLASIEFEDDIIYYVYPTGMEMFQNVLPPFLIVDSYHIKVDLTNHNVAQIGKKEMLKELHSFIENFEVEGQHNYNKDFFIKAATLEMIWSTWFCKNQFTEATYHKLETLSNDKSKKLSTNANLALGLYKKFAESGINFEYKNEDEN